MLSHYAAYTHVYLVASSSMRALLHDNLVGLEALDVFFLSESTCTAFRYVRSDTALDPMCVRALNVLVRLHSLRLVSVVDVRIANSLSR